MAWKIVTEPQGRNGEQAGSEEAAKNEGGLVIYVLADGGNRQEVGRVAFDRSNSKNPRVSFKAQAAKVVNTAKDAVGLLNNDLMGDGELQ